MGLAAITKKAMVDEYENTETLSTTYKGWDILVEPIGTSLWRRYDLTVFIAGEGCGVRVMSGRCDSIAEVKEAIVEAADYADMTAKEALTQCENFEVEGIEIEKLWELIDEAKEEVVEDE